MQTAKNPFAHEVENWRAMMMATTDARKRREYKQRLEHYERESRRWEQNQRQRDENG